MVSMRLPSVFIIAPVTLIPSLPVSPFAPLSPLMTDKAMRVVHVVSPVRFHWISVLTSPLCEKSRKGLKTCLQMRVFLNNLFNDHYALAHVITSKSSAVVAALTASRNCCL